MSIKLGGTADFIGWLFPLSNTTYGCLDAVLSSLGCLRYCGTLMGNDFNVNFIFWYYLSQGGSYR